MDHCLPDHPIGAGRIIPANDKKAMEPMIENLVTRPGLAKSAFAKGVWPKIGQTRAQRKQSSGSIAIGPLDTKSVLFALLGSITFFALGLFCLSVSRFDAVLASVWLPNGSAVVILLLARLRNELPLLSGIFVANILTNFAANIPADTAVIFAAANLAEIVIVIWLIRRSCDDRPDLADLADLGRFLFFAGIVGPFVSTAIASLALSADLQVMITGAPAWFLADSMGLILTVPAALLVHDAIRDRSAITGEQIAERSALMICGLLAVYVVFKQETYPLLFLIPPITLLMAFRLGAIGTALFVPGIAIMASWMTYVGMGPIVENSTSAVSKMYLIQAFVSANFLAGLPIVAILTARARLTQAMLEGRAKLELLAANVTDAVLSIDRNGRCTYASPSVHEVLGHEPSDFVGRLITECTHADEAERMRFVMARLLDGECDKERITYRRLRDADDGAPVFIEADCAVAQSPEKGKRSSVVVSARDVTERVELELLLTRSRRNAERAAHAKSEFLANMSHEIRTPMNGVLGFAELMLQGDLSEENRRHTEMIVQSGRSMMLLLNDILDLSKIEAGQIAIDSAPLDLYATISECAVLHRPAAQKKGLELVFDPFSPGKDDTSKKAGQKAGAAARPWVESDALRLRQIILNLVANAIKFTESGRVEISCAINENEFIVEVQDTGIGISEARIQTIFAPFTQGESDTARRYGGTGLGLTISRQLAELLGGEISVVSEPGIGSVFRLRLPAIFAEPTFTPPPETVEIDPSDIPQSARILLVEDHDVNRMLGAEMLERCGQSVAIAQDGNEAIAMVIDSVMRERPFDLVFMDIQMPGCDGYAATRTLRAEGIGPDIMPIIALTANAFPEDIAEARQAGMQAHLAKPLVFADLARALQRWLPTQIVEASEGGEEGSSLDPEPRRLEPKNAPGFRSSPPNPLIERQSRELEQPKSLATTFVANHVASTSMSGLDARPQNLSPSLIERWNERRSEAIEAVRSALETGILSELRYTPDAAQDLARLVHKLAGTAAIFGEPELGDQAAALERALRQDLSSDVREALAFELLSVADDPADTLAASAG